MSAWQFIRWLTAGSPRSYLAMAAAVEAIFILSIVFIAGYCFPLWWGVGLGLAAYGLHIAIMLATLSDIRYQRWIRSKFGGPHL